MDKEQADRVVEETAQKLLEESNKDSLYLKVSLEDLESAKHLLGLIYSKEGVGNGIHIDAADWSISGDQVSLYSVRDQLLQMVKDIRPLDYTEY